VEAPGIESGETSGPNVVRRSEKDADQATQGDQTLRGVSAFPTTMDEAIRLAAKVAIDAGEYERARG
jgi:hypothetical protein